MVLVYGVYHKTLPPYFDYYSTYGILNIDQINF